MVIASIFVMQCWPNLCVLYIATFSYSLWPGLLLHRCRVHSFVYVWCTFMYLDGTLVILTTGEMKLCLGVASQHKYVRLLCVRVVMRIVHHSQLLCWQVCC